MDIVVKDLNVFYDNTHIIKNVNLQLRSGEMTAFLGLNGAGKTTFIKAITGLRKPESGTVLYNGTELLKIRSKERAKIISYVPQKSELAFRYTVEEFVKMGATPYVNVFGEFNRSEDAVNEALEYLKIENLKNRFVDELSGGELKMVYLARCRVQKTEWMVLDEPTEGLDFKREHEFLQQLNEYVTKNKGGVFLTMHNPSLAKTYADRIICMKDGQVLGDVRKIEKDFEEKLYNIFQLMYGEEIADYI